ncbi:OB-fold nucleic acid binding domain-containing protein [Arthrobacter sp. 35W]|uniref:OB-fold nucleic acid binding domain-containing protein n=1 Tax=Arthrobacter sp. 35W TaxID=1132441 RepID=UPI000413D897|nr:OB-fold nucleic acid binding domain-containing protein [Arthrobacter sp. 35W]
MAIPQDKWPEATPICDLPVRGRAVCGGFIDSVTILPAALAPQFSAIVTDRDKYDHGAAKAGENHRVRLVWLGRRRVPGIVPGVRLRLEGMVSMRDGLPTIFNPRYEIIGKQES